MKNHTQHFDNSPVSFNMMSIEGGTFDMGSDTDSPIHPVVLSPFGMGEHPVTQAVWKAVMGEDNNPARFKHDKRPVEQVSWQDITEQFLPKLNQLAHPTLPQGTHYRLPTEAEWEYAARGGGNWRNDFPYAGGHILAELGWYRDNSNGKTMPVGLKFHNTLGLFDMNGNVWEWCHDWYDAQYYQECLKKGTVKDPCCPNEGTHRVVRGGGWDFDAENCRPTFRLFNRPANRNAYFGFRLVLSSLSV